MEPAEEILAHYGVKGMRWGVRRSRSGVTKGKQEKRSSTESKRAAEIFAKAKKHGISSLTNKELGDLNKRLQLEQQFSSLNSKTNTSKISIGSKFAKEVGATAMKTAASNATAYQIGKVLKRANLLPADKKK